MMALKYVEGTFWFVKVQIFREKTAHWREREGREGMLRVRHSEENQVSEPMNTTECPAKVGFVDVILDRNLGHYCVQYHRRE
jgi:hypothetical protein